MAFSHGKQPLDSVETNVDTIDLTLSSPEPEVRSRLAPRQSQLPTYFKREPRPYSMKSERGQPSLAARTGSQQQARPIDPQHLAQMISTSDPHALRKVLFDLCKLSPALSGAVARGLAPHSQFARGLINQHRQTQQRKARRTPTEDNSDDVSARMKRRLAPSMSATQPKYEHNPVHVRGENTRMGHRPLHGSQSVPHLKRDFPPTSASDTDDDDVQNPGSLRRGVYQEALAQHSLPHMPRSASVTSRTRQTLPISERVSNTKRDSDRCARCNKTLQGGFSACVYHPGRKVKQEGNTVVFNCCNKLIVHPGCQVGAHILESDEDKNFLQRKRPSASPTPSAPKLKKPRVLPF